MTSRSAWSRTMPRVGQRAERSRLVRREDIGLFTELSGDRNPLHYDEAAARASRFGEIVVQGGVTSAILNAVVAEDLPGPGTVFLHVDWKFTAPVRPGRHDHGRRPCARGARGQAHHEARRERPPPGRRRRPRGDRGVLHDGHRNPLKGASPGRGGPSVRLEQPSPCRPDDSARLTHRDGSEGGLVGVVESPPFAGAKGL